MKQEVSLDANSLENSTHRNGFINAAITHSDNRSLIRLDALFASFLNSDANPDRIANVD